MRVRMKLTGALLACIFRESTRRTPLVPDVAPIADAGLRGYETSTWHGIVAPAATPRDRAQAQCGARESAGSRKSKRSCSGQGLDPVGGTPEQFAGYIKAEIAKWAKVAKASGAKAE